MSPADELDTLQPGPDPDKLELYHRQQLSAMLDGELSQDQARFLRRRLQHDAELSACFERWQVCGDVLRGRQVSLLPTDFAARVAAGIANDGVTVAPVAATRRPRLLRWGGGAALAASVALVALFVGRPGAFQDEVDTTLARPVADVAGPPVDPPAPDAAADASALAAVTPVDTASAALPRRDNAERSTRSQAQRAALRNAQARQEAELRVASVSAPADAGRQADIALAAAPVATGLPESGVSTRPWPKASSLSASSSFSVRYGEGFAAPSWSEPEPVGSAVLPRFPVDPADVQSSAQPRALR